MKWQAIKTDRQTDKYKMLHGITAVTAIPRDIPKLIGSFLVHPVGISLVDVHQEHQVVSEDTEAVQPGHLDDKGEQVINDGVQEFEGHLTPWQRCHTLQLVVDIQLHTSMRVVTQVSSSSNALQLVVDIQLQTSMHVVMHLRLSCRFCSRQQRTSPCLQTSGVASTKTLNYTL